MTLAVMLLLTTATGAAAIEGVVQRTELRVANLSCSSCLLRLRWELKKLDGLIGMTGNLDQQIVRVDHAASLPAEAIAATLDRLGHPATILTTREWTGNEAGPEGPGNNKGQACGPAGCTGSASCNATAKAWRQLMGRWFGNEPTGRNTQP